MSRLLAPLLGVAVLWSALGIAAPCGGGGVVPMLDLKTTLSSRVDSVPLPNGLQNFAVWERSDQVIFRDSDDQLNSLNLDQGRIDMLATGMKYPVSHVVDPGERLVLTSKLGKIFDTFFSIWRWLLSSRSVPMEHLFWHPEAVQGNVDNVLYSVAHEADDLGQNIFQIYRYDALQDNSARKWCSAIPQDTSLDIQVAMGSSYPNIYLYKVQNTAMGYLLEISKIDVSTAPCQMSQFEALPFYLAAPVRSVHWFQDGAFATFLSSGSANLVWQNGNSCEIFTVGDGSQTPMVPNPATHALAVDLGNGQVEMAFPDERKQGTVALSSQGGSVDPSNIWLMSDRSRLFVAPADASGDAQMIYQASLHSVTGAGALPR